MDTTQRTDQQRSADRRRRELLEAADRGGAARRPTGLDERHRRRGRHHQADPLPPLRRQERNCTPALAVRHTDALLASLRAALDAPAERRQRVEATLTPIWRPSRHARSIPLPDASGGGTTTPGDQADQGFDVGKHAAPLLAPHGRGTGPGHRGAPRRRPGHPAAGPGVGTRNRRHDARRRGLVAGRTPCSRAELSPHPGDLLWGRLAARPGTRRAARASDGRGRCPRPGLAARRNHLPARPRRRRHADTAHCFQAAAGTAPPEPPAGPLSGARTPAPPARISFRCRRPVRWSAYNRPSR